MMIADFDRHQALTYLACKLELVPEFARLWREARSTQTVLVETCLPGWTAVIERLSADGRGALVALAQGSPFFSMYSRETQGEASRANRKMRRLERVASKRLRSSDNYFDNLKRISEPLGVPDFWIVMWAIDLERWGVLGLASEGMTIAGPWRTYFEAVLVTALTGLAPTDLANATPRRIRERIRANVAPVSRHMRQFDLRTRIDFWIRNVVLGETQVHIAMHTPSDGAGARRFGSPEKRVKRHIKEASRILGVKRRGRPRKGGVLRHWKLMSG